MMIVFLSAPSAWAVEDDAVPAGDLRAAAARILADSAYKNFDHFPEMPRSAADGPLSPPDSPGGTTAGNSTTSPDGQGESRRDPAEWWRNLAKAKSKAKSDRDGSASQPGSSSSDSPTEPAKSGTDQTDSSRSPSTSSGGTNDSSSSSKPARTPSENSSRPTTPPPTEAKSAEGTSARPARSGTRSAPSLRGQDGVDRPVRFAPKIKPPDPKIPEWNFDFGWGDWMGNVAVGLGWLFQSLAYVALITVCVLIVLLVGRSAYDLWQRRPGSARFTPLTATVALDHDRSPGETPADVFLQEALALARTGDFRLAIGKLVLGAMSAIEQRQWIRYRRGLTLHDYLRSVRRYPREHAGLQTVTGIYEPIVFGRRAPTSESFARALEGYRAGFSTMAEPSPPDP